MLKISLDLKSNPETTVFHISQVTTPLWLNVPHNSLTGVIHTHVQYLLKFMLPLLHVSTPLFLADPSLSWCNIKQQQNITPDTTSSYTGTIRPPKLLKLQNLCLGPCLINWKKTKIYLMIWINLVEYGQIQCMVEYLHWKTKE